MKTMKKVLLTAMMVMVSAFALANNNDPKVSVERVGKKSIYVVASKLGESETRVQLTSSKGSILYNTFNNDNSFSKRFDLNALPAGNYALEVENDRSFTSIPVIIGTDSAFVKVEDQVTVIKPVVFLNGQKLDVIIPSERGAEVFVTIFDSNNNRIALESINGENLKRFDLSKLEAGNYTIKTRSNGRNFVQSISLK